MRIPAPSWSRAWGMTSAKCGCILILERRRPLEPLMRSLTRSVTMWCYQETQNRSPSETVEFSLTSWHTWSSREAAIPPIRLRPFRRRILLISAEASKLCDHGPYGKDTIEPASDRLARRSTATCVGAQARGLEAAGHSPCSWREQGCGEPVDEAGRAGGRRGAQAQASSGCQSAPQRR